VRRPRHLSADEKALWNRVADRTMPLHPQRPAAPREAHANPGPQRPVKPDPLPLFRVGEASNRPVHHDLVSPVAHRLGQAPVNMDAKAYGRMKRGKLVPDARIDLHGMTLAQAHPTLVQFVLSGVARGSRLLLVITGKGRERDDGGPMPARQGVLRHQVPQWLALPPLAGLVLQIVPAHVRHGGHGAYYVYLRKAR
jgi:DNA-nicking Smr family endonuclease